MNEPLLQVDGLSVEFQTPDGWRQVTYDVSFRVDRRKTLALVGESGSGKSVTAMSILDLLPANARRTGRILFDGVDLVPLRDKGLRPLRGSRIATIFQEPMTALNPVYTIGHQLAEALTSHHDLDRKTVRDRAIQLLRDVHMPDPEEKVDHYPHQLSGGQRQRAMIAMAISSEPDLLIADEPTTALDVTVQAEILDLISEIQERMGMAVLIITHDMGVVADVADDVVVMKDGRVVEGAPSAELFRSPKEEYTRALLAAVPHLGKADDFLSAARNKLRIDGVTAATPLPETVLRLQDAVIRYPGRWRRPGFQAINGIDLEVARGEIVGLVGESGSGKSTIGKAAIGLLPVSEGVLEVRGERITGRPGRALRQLRRHVTMVFQDPASSLNPRRTIGQAISDPLLWQGLVRDPRARRKRARELLEQVQLNPDWCDRFPHELSGGQRQRIGIARAIATDPVLMIADEPTSALDVSVQAQVLDLFLALQRELGFSCLFISHDLSVVETLSNRVVVLRHGDVIEEGPTEDVLHHPSDEYTRRLIAAAPVPDPEIQQVRRAERLALRRA
ncbi:ABC transporter ATP-binding protein [Microbacterium saperdae]|uniref:Peptide/nickel transport system ATP-binding protein n=1 Tax=Microbacterium saperdae TaxID=69368 RepID=A0A543BAB7_9MICO|nr:ABC transporter ATP-binding protein [Microbacterium saperdae]TQL81736.1 peptide/nickel transport system ATP-binding protein [Microbacterium saperdae]GGM34438.1 putative oligopeptide ABC transporter, ATP-binding protein [Microbacterium saperdae]